MQGLSSGLGCYKINQKSWKMSRLHFLYECGRRTIIEKSALALWIGIKPKRMYPGFALPEGDGIALISRDVIVVV